MFNHNNHTIKNEHSLYTFNKKCLLCNIFSLYVFKIFVCFLLYFMSSVSLCGKIDNVQTQKKNSFNPKKECVVKIPYEVTALNKLLLMKSFQDRNASKMHNGWNDDIEVTLCKFFIFLSKNKINIMDSMVIMMATMDVKLLPLFCEKTILFYQNYFGEGFPVFFEFFDGVEDLELFANYKNKNIKFIAKHPYYAQIEKIYHYCGFPFAPTVQGVETWINLNKGMTLSWLWEHLSDYFEGYEIPEKTNFFSIFAKYKENTMFFYEFNQCVPNIISGDNFCVKTKKKLHIFLMHFFLKKNKIIYSLCLIINQMTEYELLLFIDKVRCFYENISQKDSALSNFITNYEKAKKFIRYKNRDIKFIAKHPCYSYLMEIYCKCEFPPVDVVKEVDSWIYLHSGLTLEQLWKNFLKYFKAKGIPKEQLLFFQTMYIKGDRNFFKNIENWLSILKERRVQKYKVTDDGIHSKKIDQKLYCLFGILLEKRVADINSFVEVMIELQDDDLLAFCSMVTYFYINCEEKRSIVTLFLNTSEKVKLFIKYNKKDIKYITDHPYYKSIFKIYDGVGFPIIYEVKNVKYLFYIHMHSFKVGGEFATIPWLWGVLEDTLCGKGLASRHRVFHHLYMSKKLYAIPHDEEKKIIGQKIIDKIVIYVKKVRCTLLDIPDELIEINHCDECIDLITLINFIDLIDSNKSIDFINCTDANIWNDVIQKNVKSLFQILIRVHHIVDPRWFFILKDMQCVDLISLCRRATMFYVIALQGEYGMDLARKKIFQLLSFFPNKGKSVSNFINMNLSNITSIASHSCLPQLSIFYFECGFPDFDEVSLVSSWTCCQYFEECYIWYLLSKNFSGKNIPEESVFLQMVLLKNHYFLIFPEQDKKYFSKYINEKMEIFFKKRSCWRQLASSKKFALQILFYSFFSNEKIYTVENSDNVPNSFWSCLGMVSYRPFFISFCLKMAYFFEKIDTFRKTLLCKFICNISVAEQFVEMDIDHIHFLLSHPSIYDILMIFDDQMPSIKSIKEVAKWSCVEHEGGLSDVWNKMGYLFSGYKALPMEFQFLNKLSCFNTQYPDFFLTNAKYGDVDYFFIKIINSSVFYDVDKKDHINIKKTILKLLIMLKKRGEVLNDKWVIIINLSLQENFINFYLNVVVFYLNYSGHSSLTNLLFGKNTADNIKYFATCSKEVIVHVASHHYSDQILMIYEGIGMPSILNIKILEKWDCLKKNINTPLMWNRLATYSRGKNYLNEEKFNKYLKQDEEAYLDTLVVDVYHNKKGTNLQIEKAVEHLKKYRNFLFCNDKDNIWNFSIEKLTYCLFYILMNKFSFIDESWFIALGVKINDINTLEIFCRKALCFCEYNSGQVSLLKIVVSKTDIHSFVLRSFKDIRDIAEQCFFFVIGDFYFRCGLPFSCNLSMVSSYCRVLDVPERDMWNVILKYFDGPNIPDITDVYSKLKLFLKEEKNIECFPLFFIAAEGDI